MQDLQLKQFSIGRLVTNSYLLHNSSQAVLIDIGGEPAAVLKYLQTNKLELLTIFNTHLHFDHVYGNRALAEATGAKIMGNERDSFIKEENVAGKGMFGLPPVPPFEFENLDEGVIEVLGAECRVLATPGHTPGSLSFYFPAQNWIFCGDLLFHRAVGRTDFKGGDSEALAESLRGKVYTLPDDTIAYPGHDEETVVGDEKRLNPYVRA
ncbi:MAG: MBL fold metallo-hydrolase [Deltaproteobacteria bacterium]|jgi:glyoxylase-like metal-dependent hydrolase (beta-lactamase superfamily II)|nr:MBL fold metallo-hydrolase [Deltaproteobacteria bacterium]